MSKLYIDFSEQDSADIEYEFKDVNAGDAAQCISIICDHINRILEDLDEEDQNQTYQILAGIVIEKGKEIGLFEDI